MATLKMSPVGPNTLQQTETVSQVSDNGEAKVVGFGEGAITAWYLSRIDIATITVPYTNKVAKSVFTRAKRRNFIDDSCWKNCKASAASFTPLHRF